MQKKSWKNVKIGGGGFVGDEEKFTYNRFYKPNH
jgi:hypothetical protein